MSVDYEFNLKIYFLNFLRMCDEKGEAVVRDRVYHLQDEQQTPVDPDCMNKGYRYINTNIIVWKLLLHCELP